MRRSARALLPQIAVIITALVIVGGFLGCGDKGGGDEQAAGGPGMPGGPEMGGMPGGPGGMPGGPGGMPGGMPGGPGGMPGGMPGGAGGMPGGPEMGGMPGGPGGMPGGSGMGGPGGAPGGAPGAAPGGEAGDEGGGAPAAGPAPAAPKDVKPAPPPTKEQTELVDEALVMLRTLMTRNVPAPEPEEVEEGPAEDSAAPSPEGPGEPGGDPAAAQSDGPSDMKFAQAGPEGEGGPGMGGPGGGGMGGPGGAGAGAAPAGGGSMPAMALVQTIKKVCQKTRGIQMADRKWFNEYTYFESKSLLDEVLTQYSDFPVIQLSHAAQVKSDWEGYLWHWAMRKMLQQTDFSSLEDVGAHVAKARVALAGIHALCRYGLLMHDVDRTRLGGIIFPTVEHAANCIQFAFGNPNYDPATVKRDETKRSRLMVEIFDNYLKQGHNWYWERSRNWSYLSRVSANVPAYYCDSCGLKMTRDHQTWRCPRCGKAARFAVPGTFEVVEPNDCLECDHRDQYRTSALQCPACESGPARTYKLRRGWNAPTFARRRQGMKNAQRVHHLASLVFTEDAWVPTEADRDAYETWVKASTCPERVPELHQMQLEVHELRLRDAALPNGKR